MANRRGSRIVPLAFGIAMLAVILAAGLFPNAGTVQAQSTCPYGGCTSSTPSVPVWEYVSILVLIAAGAIVALLFIMRRRRPPRQATVAPWSGPPAAAGPAGPTPSYIETPEDVGHAPPSVAPSVAPAAPAAGAAEGTESGSDIDSLMAELDKISTEILKKPPKKGADGKDADEAGAADETSESP